MSPTVLSLRLLVSFVIDIHICYKTRFSVCHQVFQLQQEKKKLQEDFSSLLQDRETLERRCATIQREQTQLGPRLEETKWEVSESDSGELFGSGRGIFCFCKSFSTSL